MNIVNGRASKRVRALLRRRTRNAGTGCPMPFRVREPKGSSSKKPVTSVAVSPLTTIWPGSPTA